MPSVPLTSLEHSYLIDTNGEYVVTPNASLTSKARHVVARSSGKAVFTRGAIGPLVAPKGPLIACYSPTCAACNL